MTYKFRFTKDNQIVNNFDAFILDKNYRNYLQLFKDDFKEYDKVGVYEYVDGKPVYKEQIEIITL